MQIKWLEEFYGIQINQQTRVGRYEGFINNEQIFIMAPLSENKDSIQELQGIAEHLVHSGDRHILIINKTKFGQLWGEKEGKSFCLLSCQLRGQKTLQHPGRKLAKFHLRGLTIPFKVERTSRIGQWKQLWEKRLTQMENVWRAKLYQAPENEFERMFIESFPYYLGLTENSIQYLVDSELDGTPEQRDNGTVCHERFSHQTWGRDYLLKNPLDWVFDHRSRDLAEWTRSIYFESKYNYHQQVRKFFQDYQQLAPLSAFGWRLLFSRLIFPLHYFECIEEYYLSTSEQAKKSKEEKLSKLLKASPEYEMFLKEFFLLTDAPIRVGDIPQLDWMVQ
jgi:spore coat protein YutH